MRSRRGFNEPSAIGGCGSCRAGGAPVGRDCFQELQEVLAQSIRCSQFRGQVQTTHVSFSSKCVGQLRFGANWFQNFALVVSVKGKEGFNDGNAACEDASARRSDDGEVRRKVANDSSACVGPIQARVHTAAPAGPFTKNGDNHPPIPYRFLCQEPDCGP